MQNETLAEFTPEDAPRHAKWVATWYTAKDREWDYSLDSLAWVELTLDHLRLGGVKPATDARTPLGMGCYLGELLVRQGNGRWVPANGTWLINGVGEAPMLIELPYNLGLCNPLAWSCDYLRSKNAPRPSTLVQSLLKAVTHVQETETASKPPLNWVFSQDHETQNEYYLATQGEWVAVVMKTPNPFGAWAAFLQDGEGERRVQESGMTLFMEVELAREWCVEELRRVGQSETP